jgi:radical SAM superfamily enzyme YgiQ (UPF0313 family)
VRPRHALLVQPFYRKDPHGSFGKHVLTPSLALTSLAAATPPDWTVSFWDENLLQGPPPDRPCPEVVGITVHLTFAARAYELAAHFRRLGARVVLGGPHVTACPEEAAPHADAIAIGEGVRVWPVVLRDVAAGSLRRVYRGSHRLPYREEPLPRRDVLPAESFLTTLSLIATRGCRNRCDFCYLSTRGLDMPWQARDVQQVAEQFRREGGGYGVFIDNNLGADEAFLRDLCRVLRPLEVIWSAAVTLDLARSPALVREMALAGCTGVFVGFESLTEANLEASRKRGPRPDEYAGCVRVFHDHGVQVNGSFVFGFDHDGPDVFEESVAWIEDNRLECATFHILTPYPGTPLFRRLEREGRILHRDWSRYDTGHAVFRPTRMSPDELEEGYVRCYRRVFSHRSIWKHRPADPRAVLPYLAMAYLYKRSNGLWRFLIRHRLTAAVWRPLIEATRRRHLRFRRRLERETTGGVRAEAVLPAGV